MGTGIDVYIEYDPAVEYNYSPLPPPFEPCNESICLSDWVHLRCGKDYRFIGAISGVENQTGIPPLFPPRGLPENACSYTLFEMDVTDSTNPPYGCFGWLLASEVRAAIAHHGWTRGDLSFPVETLLNTLDFLESRLGPDRVRIVFEIN